MATPPVFAHSNDVLSAFAEIKPIIDGVLTPGEWDDADTRTFTLNVVATNKVTEDTMSESFPTTLRMKNDEDYLYIAVILGIYDDIDEYGLSFLNFSFDNDNDGECDIGDDYFGIRFDGLVHDSYYPDGIPISPYNDTGDGGAINVFAAITYTNPVALTGGGVHR